MKQSQLNKTCKPRFSRGKLNNVFFGFFMICHFRKLKRKQLSEQKFSHFNLCLCNSFLPLLMLLAQLCSLFVATQTELLKFIYNFISPFSTSDFGAKNNYEFFSSYPGKANIVELCTIALSFRKQNITKSTI